MNFFTDAIDWAKSKLNPTKNERVIQKTLMIFDPVTGNLLNDADIRDSETYRSVNGTVAWLYDPWDGVSRDSHRVLRDLDCRKRTIDNQLPYDTDSGVIIHRLNTIFRDEATTRAWFFNPYTGERRTPKDIGTDPLGKLIPHDPEGFLRAHLQRLQNEQKSKEND